MEPPLSPHMYPLGRLGTRWQPCFQGPDRSEEPLGRGRPDHADNGGEVSPDVAQPVRATISKALDAGTGRDGSERGTGACPLRSVPDGAWINADQPRAAVAGRRSWSTGLDADAPCRTDAAYRHRCLPRSRATTSSPPDGGVPPVGPRAPARPRVPVPGAADAPTPTGCGASAVPFPVRMEIQDSSSTSSRLGPCPEWRPDSAGVRPGNSAPVHGMHGPHRAGQGPGRPWRENGFRGHGIHPALAARGVGVVGVVGPSGDGRRAPSPARAPPRRTLRGVFGGTAGTAPQLRRRRRRRRRRSPAWAGTISMRRLRGVALYPGVHPRRVPSRARPQAPSSASSPAEQPTHFISSPPAERRRGLPGSL
eukprot:scaffold1183_cov418-Prasinococcus_capsulatus_cf.AAC.22